MERRVFSGATLGEGVYEVGADLRRESRIFRMLPARAVRRGTSSRAAMGAAWMPGAHASLALSQRCCLGGTPPTLLLCTSGGCCAAAPTRRRPPPASHSRTGAGGAGDGRQEALREAAMREKK